MVDEQFITNTISITKMKTPLATVLMPVYNVGAYLKEAIDSILQQTYSDFIFLIVDDCSTDNTEEIVASYKDSRIKYLKNERNLGLADALNVGVDAINTKYIIRMDGDDISVPHRFETLINYMETHPEIGVYSSRLERFGTDFSVWKYPLANDDIKAHLLFGPSIAHAPAIIRTSVMKENKIFYRNDFKHVEDYDLWFRLKDVTKFANTDEVLYKYRVATHNITVFYSDDIVDRKKQFYSWVLTSFGINFTEEELEMHIALANNKRFPKEINVAKYRKWFDKIISHNKQTNYFEQAALLRQVENRWEKLFFILSEKEIKKVFTYFRISKGVKSTQMIYLLKIITNKYILRR